MTIDAGDARGGRPIRVVVIDDHPAIAEAIASRSVAAGLRVVGTAADVDAGARVVVETTPDVVVCDVRLTGQGSGLDLLRRWQATPGRSPAVLMLSSFDYPAFTLAAMEAGAAGYLVKSASLDEIASAIATVAAGGSAFSLSAVQAAARALRSPSARELGLLERLAAGRSNDEIATDLGISPKTVESHLRRLFGRYGVLSRTELAILAVREGWIEA